jgi:hypothetical protein
MQSKDHSIPKIGSMAEDKVAAEVAEYVRFHNDDKEDRTAERKGKYAAMVNAYYNLATDFYEWGWGQSFHFAVQAYTESFQTSIVRHEHYLALRLRTHPLSLASFSSSPSFYFLIRIGLPIDGGRVVLRGITIGIGPLHTGCRVGEGMAGA